MFVIVRILAAILNAIYGYEGMNLLFRFLPSSHMVKLLRLYGARVGEKVRILNPLIIHNADKGMPIFKNLSIGNEVFIGRAAFLDLAQPISIADRVTISHFLSIHTHTDAGKSILSNEVIPPTEAPVFIREDAYIGASVCILQGVNIGESSLIAAGSLVNSNVNPHSMMAGIPAILKKQID